MDPQPQPAHNTLNHYLITIHGRVQGVGFRPFIYRLAHELALEGEVWNNGAGVEIAVQGYEPQLQTLLQRIPNELPPHAELDELSWQTQAINPRLSGFHINTSQSSRVSTMITPDSAICDHCLHELFDAQDRRYLHPFINCMHCGPRYTLVHRLPYDRSQTSMAKFAQCPDCLQEYQDPLARRFHAQPNACPDCGPQLALYDRHGQAIIADHLIAAAAERIRTGEILAIKGLGGFHLVCDARSDAVTTLRQRKQRPFKPLAIMLLNSASLSPYTQAQDDELELLNSSERPIVLLDKSPQADTLLPGIAPHINHIGVMLPYTPLHYLLFHQLLGNPSGHNWLQQACDIALVMTSANHAGEPLAINDEEAQHLLGDIVDATLTHNRDILQRCDDSVLRLTLNGAQQRRPQFIRRARGYTPQPFTLPANTEPVLACGAWLKNTICLTRDKQAFISQHIGDLDNVSTRQMLHECVAHLSQLLDVTPALVVHDLHPDYYSSQFAQAYANERQLPTLAVQHHHAHIAAVCAEHQLHGPVLGLALDGVGLGWDNQAWGGELLQVDGLHCERLGHLQPLLMPGGDKAAREPWRMAASALFACDQTQQITQRFADQAAATMLPTVMQRGLNCPPTSSMGRLFDAAAGLLGRAQIQDFEGHAAMQLEALAARHGNTPALPHGYHISNDNQLSFIPLLHALIDAKDQALAAAQFHATLGAGLAEWVIQSARQQHLSRIALAGGCLLNQLLAKSLLESLNQAGLQVYTAARLPPNDGAIAFGQAWLGQLYLHPQ